MQLEHAFMEFTAQELATIREALQAFKAWQQVESDDPHFAMTARRWETAKLNAAFVVMVQLQEMECNRQALVKGTSQPHAC